METVSFAICSARRFDHLIRCLDNLDQACRSLKEFKAECVLLHGYEGAQAEQLAARKHSFELQLIDEGTVDLPSKSWPCLYNHAISETRGALFSFYSDDILIERGSLEAACLHVMENQTTCASAFAWRNHDDVRYRIGHVLGNHVLINFGLIRRDVFDRVGGISEEYRFYYADSDLCLKMISAGYRISAFPEVRIVHDDLNRGHADPHGSAYDTRLYQQKWVSRVGNPTGYWVYYP